MIYGNGNFDDFTLEANGMGNLYLVRNGIKTFCHLQQGEIVCGDWCSVFHRCSCDLTTTVHLCCTTPPTVILVKPTIGRLSR